MLTMEPMPHTDGSYTKVPLIRDYNNITPAEIQNVLKILSQESNGYVSNKKKRKTKNVNSGVNFIKKHQEIPECYGKLQRELSPKPMTLTENELLKKKSERNVDSPIKEKGLPSKIVSTSNLTTTISSSKRKKKVSRRFSKSSKDSEISVTGIEHFCKIHSEKCFCLKSLYSSNENYEGNNLQLNNEIILLTDSERNNCTTSIQPLHCMPICVTLDSSDEEVVSSKENNPIVASKYNGSILLSDSEESEVEFIPADVHGITEIIEEDVQYLNSVEEGVQSVCRVEDDVQSACQVEDDVQSTCQVEDDVHSVSTVEDDHVLQKWRNELKKNSVPCVVVSSDDEAVYELEDECLSKDSHFFTDNLKTLFECPVCFESINNCTNLSSTICGHIFCTNCITKSVTNYKKCPTCNCRLNLSLVHPVYLNF